MVLLNFCLTAIEKSCLGVMVGKEFSSYAKFAPILMLCERLKPSRRVLARPIGCEAVGLVIDAAFRHIHAHMSVALKVRERTFGRVNGNLGKLGTAEPLKLRIQVRKETTLHQRVVRIVDARHDITHAKGDLLGFRKEIAGI